MEKVLNYINVKEIILFIVITITIKIEFIYMKVNVQNVDTIHAIFATFI